MASLADPRLRQLGRRLVAFYRPELLGAAEMAQFKGYLRDKWSAADTPETEWMTPGKAKAAIDKLRSGDQALADALNAIGQFVDARRHSVKC